VNELREWSKAYNYPQGPFVLYTKDKALASTMTGSKTLTENPKQEILVPHVQGYPLGWLTGHWEFDKVLLRAYRMIPDADMKVLRSQLRYVQLAPYTTKLSNGRWAIGTSLGETGTVLIRPDIIKRGARAMLIVILHELAHQVDQVVLSPIMAERRHDGKDYDLISEWVAVLRVSDWGYGFELGQALRGDGWLYVPSEEEARRIAHRIRSHCGSCYGLVRSLQQTREILASHPEWGVTLEGIEDEEWRSPKKLLAMISTVTVVDRLFDLWGYRRMNPKFVPRMWEAYEDLVDGQEL